MTIDPRTPVLVGASHVDNRSDTSAEPVAMMTEAVDAALRDARITGADVDVMRVVKGIWPYADPGRLIAEAVGAPNARTTLTVIGGNEVFDLVNNTAARIQAGEFDVAVICGAEALRTRRRDHAAGVDSVYLAEPDDAAPSEPAPAPKPHGSGRELETGALTSAVTFYAMVETAIRHRRGETIDTHRERVAALWAGASDVAATNPNAWLREPASASDIATPGPRNRMVAYPYPKLMTSNINVDQGAAAIMVSAGYAERAGIARDRWVFPQGGSGAHDHWSASTRWAIDESPAMRLAGLRALDLAGTAVGDVELLDLYSCFPAAVQLAQRELEIDPSRPFTITGGLTFAGGPLNCYCLVSLVRSISLLRDEPAKQALLSGNGGFFTKHSFCVLGGEPQAQGFRWESVQSEVDALPKRAEAADATPDAAIEAYAVTYGRDGEPAAAAISSLTPAGERWWAKTVDNDALDALIATDMVGTPLGAIATE